MSEPTRALRVLIVDDEPLARERIRNLLTDDPEVEIVGEAADGSSAVDAILRLQPELVFLDVQMPEMDGFAVLEALEALDPSRVPAVVFVTAFDRYALRAFEVVALDYLLKPFDEARFRAALGRARLQIRSRETAELGRKLGGLLEALGRKHAKRLAIKDAGRVTFMSTGEIRWIEAQGNYVRLHGDGESRMLRRTMKAIGDRLDPARFVRIHRSIIVNLDHVRELQPLFHGEYRVVLRDGTELTSNRSFKDSLQRMVDDFS
jgi:two-component system LytT family response regulator